MGDYPRSCYNEYIPTMTISRDNKKTCCMTPLLIGFEKVAKAQYHDWLKSQCEQLHDQIKKDGRYGFRFFSGSRYMYAVKFHHDDTYDVYRMQRTTDKEVR